MSHGASKKKTAPKAHVTSKKKFKSTALGTYAEMLNWEQRIKNEEMSCDEWAHTWGTVYKPNEDYESKAKELEREIEAAKKTLKELNGSASEVAIAERTYTSKDFRRRATANDLGGPAQPV